MLSSAFLSVSKAIVRFTSTKLTTRSSIATFFTNRMSSSIAEASGGMPTASLKRKPDTGSGNIGGESAEPRKKRHGGRRGGRWNKRKMKKQQAKQDPDPTTAEGILTKFTIPKLLKEEGVSADSLILNDGTKNWRFEDQIVEGVKIRAVDLRGDGLAVIERSEEAEGERKNLVCVIPFGLPGDTVKLKLREHRKIINGAGFITADLLEVQEASELRLANEKIPCKYFGLCSGCQLQHLGYADQLKLKKRTIENAYMFLTSEEVQEKEDIAGKICETVGSPLLMGYRTKLTPHYDLKDVIAVPPRMPRIGYEAKGRPEWNGKPAENSRVIDIEDCIIGTPIVRQGMKDERSRLRKKFETEGQITKKGATLLLRENTIPESAKETAEGSVDIQTGKTSTMDCEVGGEKFVKTCVTRHKATVNEYVDGLHFTFLANEFFQNNNSILPKVLEYVQGKLDLGGKDSSYLVDAYCGSGLFSIASAKSVKQSLGVEIQPQSIDFARKNAELNHIDNCKFIVGKAEKLFESIDFPKDHTSVILDPPRKGCDKVFLDQLSSFEPRRIVYVSCNVHSQARDVQMFLTDTKNGSKYHIESIRGFDFFPQTYHVESVAVLTRAEQ